MVNNISESPNNQPVDTHATQNNDNSTKLLDSSDKLLPHMSFFASAMENQDWNKDFNNMSSEYDHVQENTDQSKYSGHSNEEQQEDTLRKLEEQTRQRVDDMLQH